MSDGLLASLGVKVDPSGAKSGAIAVNNAINSMQNKAKRFATSARASFNSVGGAIAKLGGLFGGLSIGLALRGALTEFKDFEQGMKNVAAVSGATEEELAKLSATALELAKSTVFNPAQTTEALYSLASAGLAANEQLAALPNVLNFAAAAQADLGQATEVTVSLMNNFNLDASSTGRIVDVLTASIGASAQNMNRLQVGLRNGAPTAAAFGLSLEGSIAAINILTTSFGNGELAGTGFKTVLLELKDKSKELGIEVTDSSGNLLEMEQVIRNLEEAGKTGADIMDIMGNRSGPALAILLGKGSQAIADMTEKIQANGQAAEVAAQQMDTLGGDIAQLGSAYDVLEVKIGEANGGMLRSIVQTMTSWVNAVSDNLKLIGAEIQILKAQWTPLWNLITDGLTQIANWVLPEGDGNVFGVIARSIQELPTNFVAAKEIIIGEAKILWAKLKAAFLVGASNIGGAFDSIYFWFAEMALKMRKVWATFMDWLTSGLAAALDKVGKALIAIPFGQFAQWGSSILSASNALKTTATNVAQIDAKLAALKVKQDAVTQAQKDYNAAIATGKQAAIDAAQAQIDKALEARDAQLEANQAIRDAAIEAQNLTTEIEETGETAVEAGQKGAEMGETIGNGACAAVTKAKKCLTEYEKAMEKARNDAQRHWDRIIGSLDFGNIIPLLQEAVYQGFSQGAKSGFAVLRDGFKASPGGFIAGAAGIANDFVNRNRAYNAPNELGLDPYGDSLDGTLRALSETILPIVAMMGPWGAAIAAVIGLVDNISGGKLFGTAYELKESTFNVGIDNTGASGSTSTKETRQKSFFRGKSTRITQNELNSDTATAINELFDAIEATMQQAATALGKNIPAIIAGELEQKFDPDGNLTSSISTVLGKTYQEGFEQFAKRLTAENLLAVLGEGLDSTTTQRRLTDQEILTQEGYDRSDYGPNKHAKAAKAAQAIIDRVRDSGMDVITETLNEIDHIAERWRYDAELLLDGASFLLAAMGDIKAGYDLMAGGTLTEMADLIEELNTAGETLAQTYVKVKTSTVVFEDALSLMGVELDLSREEFIKFSTSITDSAGGLNAALGLWQNFFDNYFSGHEIATLTLGKINDRISTLTADLGIDDIDFESFRERFENALPNLTPEEVAIWLELGGALAQANELALALSGGLSTYFIDSLQAYLDASYDASTTTESLTAALARTRDEVHGLIDAYDGSAEAEADLIAKLGERYGLELQFLDQIKNASMSIAEIIGTAVEKIRLAGMDDEEKYDFLTDEAEKIAATIAELNTPEEIESAVREINRLQSEAFALLDETQIAQLSGGFEQFLIDVGNLAQSRLEELKATAEEERDDIASRLAVIMDARAAREEAAFDKFDSSVEAFERGASIINAAAGELSNVQVTVTVNRDEFETG